MARRRSAWPRWLGLAAIVVVLLLLGLAVALGIATLGLASRTPSLTGLMRGVPAQTTVIYDSAGHSIAELHGAIDRVIVPA
jgi:membrane carboxypeptidase/penicillin-binding protein